MHAWKEGFTIRHKTREKFRGTRLPEVGLGFQSLQAGVGKRVVPRLRELAPLGQRESGLRRQDSSNLWTTLLPSPIRSQHFWDWFGSLIRFVKICCKQVFALLAD